MPYVVAFTLSWQSHPLFFCFVLFLTPIHSFLCSCDSLGGVGRVGEGETLGWLQWLIPSSDDFSRLSLYPGKVLVSLLVLCIDGSWHLTLRVVVCSFVRLVHL